VTSEVTDSLLRLKSDLFYTLADCRCDYTLTRFYSRVRLKVYTSMRLYIYFCNSLLFTYHCYHCYRFQRMTVTRGYFARMFDFDTIIVVAV